jgi:hypothetical protein
MNTNHISPAYKSSSKLSKVFFAFLSPMKIKFCNRVTIK